MAGRSSTEVTVQGRRCARSSLRLRAAPSSSSRALLSFRVAGRRIEVLAGGEAGVPDPGQPGNERGARAAEVRLEVPVRALVEGTAFLLALDDQAHRYALDAPRAESGLHLLPEHRRDHVAVQPIHDAAALLRVDELQVDLPGVIDGGADGLLGDLVELDAADGDLRLEHLAQMPADGLTLAIRVGRQQHDRRVLDRRSEIPDAPSLVARDDVVRPEAVLDVDAHVAPRLVLDAGGHFAGVLWQVADMADTGLDAVFVAQQACERLGLGRRLDDDEWPRHRRQYPFAEYRTRPVLCLGGIRSASVAPAPSRSAPMDRYGRTGSTGPAVRERGARHAAQRGGPGEPQFVKSQVMTVRPPAVAIPTPMRVALGSRMLPM